jgi:hypothetical protein
MEVVTTANLPEASVILVASEGVQSIGKIMACLQSQSVSRRLEVLIAARADAVSELERIPWSDFHSVRVLEADLSTSARARVSAIMHATGPILLFCEDHAFPIGREWAERLIKAHRSPNAAVGPVVRNANPASTSSWANLLIEYGPWLHREEAGETATLPGHNSSYKREVLIGYAETLADMLEAEWVLQKDLRRKGHTFWIDPSIEVEHLNFSLFGSTIQLQFMEGWMFAATRSADWTWPRRLAYALSFPAIAIIRFVRLCRQFFSSPQAAPDAIRSLPACFFHLCVSAVGEGVGYAFGDLGRRSALARLEYSRWRNMQENERPQAFSL